MLPTARLLPALAVALALMNAPARAQAPALALRSPPEAQVFALWELAVEPRGPLSALAGLPDTQVHDACDADRDGVFARLSATFTNAEGETMTVPGFAMRETPDGPWLWRVRWAARREGTYTVRVRFEGRAAADVPALTAEQALPEPVIVRAGESAKGPLVAPEGGDNPYYLRELLPDGRTRAAWLFGACRAWVVRPDKQLSAWAADEWIDRETELLEPMRRAGYNLLSQWMAPWEYLLVHRDRAEYWRNPDDTWRRVPRPEEAAWTSWQCLDQGRAEAFDRLVRQCEGASGRALVRLLLTPLPHKSLQMRLHPWAATDSNWSPEDDPRGGELQGFNGFSGFRAGMSAWEFFQADPALPLDDDRAKLFDHQANFYRYLIARWGYSSAVGAWVILDELEGVGDDAGFMAWKSGWWARPECERWLANVMRLFRGELVRSDGLRYAGDPFGHPLHAATTSHSGQMRRGDNLDWPGGPPGERADLLGWHWYPQWSLQITWPNVWTAVTDGIATWSQSPVGPAPRLISEFGAEDRFFPDEPPMPLYPSLYHFAIWASLFSGQAGTAMDWDDGKQFGELRWRQRPGAFERARYPIDHTAQMAALRRFLGGLEPERLRPANAPDAAVRCLPEGDQRVFALYGDAPSAVYGWMFISWRVARFRVRGLDPGRYALAWYDPWNGLPLTPARAVFCQEGEDLDLDPAEALPALRRGLDLFPQRSREARGRDIAFKLVRMED